MLVRVRGRATGADVPGRDATRPADERLLTPMRNARIRCTAAHYLCLACHVEVCALGAGRCGADAAGVAGETHGPLTLLRSVEEQERAARDDMQFAGGPCGDDDTP
jgi:hypothetical protein